MFAAHPDQYKVMNLFPFHYPQYPLTLVLRNENEDYASCPQYPLTWVLHNENEDYA